MNNFREVEKPAILIYARNAVRIELYEELLNGIEEEGLPYRIVKKDSNDAFALASMASEASVLVAGIGIDSENIVLHHEKMSKSEYLFLIKISDNMYIKREMGECAARLVKKTPFKNLYIQESK
jgi:Trk K+ transport system NAD-binding subunit